MPVTRPDHLVLTVRDLQRTLAWYDEVAGMQHLMSDERPAELGARLARVGVPIELGHVRRDGAMGPMTSYSLRDPDANVIELSSYG